MRVFVEDYKAIKHADVEIKGLTLITGENSAGKCVVGSSRVVTQQSYSKIENLCKGSVTDFTKSVNIPLFEGTATSFIKQVKKEVYTVSLGVTEITGTVNHKLRCATNKGFEWRRIGDLSVGDLVLLRKVRTSFIGEWDIPDFLKGVSQEEFSYLLGWWYGDGCLELDSQGKIKSISFCFGGKEEEDILKEILRKSKQFSKFKKYYRTACAGNGVFRLNSKLSLAGAGSLFKGNSSTKEVPEVVFSLSELLRRNFIAGVMDSDGHFAKKRKSAEITLASKIFIKELQQLLILERSFWRYSEHWNKKYHKFYYRLSWSSLSGIVALPLRISYKIAGQVKNRIDLAYGWGKGFNVPDFLREDICKMYFAEPRTREEGSNFPGKQFTRDRVRQVVRPITLERIYAHPFMANSEFKSEIESGKLFKIERIDFFGKEDVFDLQVPSTEQYVCNGISVHNSTLIKAIKAAVYNSSNERSCRHGKKSFKVSLLVEDKNNEPQIVTYGRQTNKSYYLDSTGNVYEKMGKKSLQEVFPNYPLKIYQFKDSKFFPNIVFQQEIPLFSQVDIYELLSAMFQLVSSIMNYKDTLKREVSIQAKELEGHKATLLFAKQRVMDLESQLALVDLEEVAREVTELESYQKDCTAYTAVREKYVQQTNSCSFLKEHAWADQLSVPELSQLIAFYNSDYQVYVQRENVDASIKHSVASIQEMEQSLETIDITSIDVYRKILELRQGIVEVAELPDIIPITDSIEPIQLAFLENEIERLTKAAQIEDKVVVEIFTELLSVTVCPLCKTEGIHLSL